MTQDEDLKAVRVAARKAAEAAAALEAAMVAARASGAPLRAIADAAGMTHPGVAKVLARVGAASGIGG